MDSADTNAVKRRAWEKTHTRFRDDLHVHSSEWGNEQLATPERLYHYTTLDGMRGISESQKLWLSDARYMNDASELEYATNLIDEEVSSVLKQPDHRQLVESSFRVRLYGGPVDTDCS